MGLDFSKGIGRAEDQRTMNLKQLSATVDRISVDGLGRTKDDIVIEIVEDLFKVNNFEEMMVKAHTIKNNLDSLGCFHNTYIYVDTSSGPKATPGSGYEVTFKVHELKHLVGGVQTMVGTNNEGLLVVSGTAPNILGRGEKVQGEISHGSKQTKNYNINVSKPLLGLTKYYARVAGSFFYHTQEWPMSKYKLGENGITLDFSFFSFKSLKHNIQWEGIIREISVGNRYASFDVRENSGSTLKSSIKHILTYDTRRSTGFPSSGTLSKLTTELAGLGGNVGFFKNEGLLQLNIPLFSDIVLQGSIAGGCIVPVDSDKKSIVICDHFFLGGPVSFRGFEMRGAGPSTDGNFTGGKMYWTAGVSLFTPLPFRPSVGGFGDYFRTHFFLNMGNVGNFKSSDGLPSLLHQARLAYGVGLALKFFNVARLEVNYCFPTWYQEGDRAAHGIQIGLSTAV